MANVNRNAFVVVRGDGSYLSGFKGVGVGEPFYCLKLCEAQMYSSLGVAGRFCMWSGEGSKVRRVDLNLNDV